MPARRQGARRPTGQRSRLRTRQKSSRTAPQRELRQFVGHFPLDQKDRRQTHPEKDASGFWGFGCNARKELT